MGYIALCAWREARGEGPDGLLGVLNVIRNRTDRWYYNQVDPYHYAIFLKGQFTSMSDPSDPQYRLFPEESDPVWQFCLNNAANLVAGGVPDNTGGALYYANLETMDKQGWFARKIVGNAKAHPLLVKINHHSFYA